MLIKTNSRNERGTLYISLIEVTSGGGGIYDTVIFFKRSNNQSDAENWHNKLLKDTTRGKWNIHNSHKLPTIWNFVNKNYDLYGFLNHAGQDTIDFGFTKDSKKIREYVEKTETDRCRCKKCVEELGTVTPDILITGGWDPSISCNPEGGSCTVSWNCGTRKYPKDCELRIKYPGEPIIITIHPSPGTVSRQTFYIWRLPEGWELLDNRLYI